MQAIYHLYCPLLLLTFAYDINIERLEVPCLISTVGSVSQLTVGT